MIIKAIAAALAVSLVLMAALGALKALGTAAASQSPVTPAERLREQYWNHLMAVDPLDGCTLGVREACGRLPDLGPKARQERTDFETAVLERLDDLRLDDLRDEIAMDMVAIRRLAEHWVVRSSSHAQLNNLEYAENLPILIVLQAGQAKTDEDWRRVVQRLLGVGSLLTQQQHNLQRAVEVESPPDYVETLRIVEHVVPNASSMLSEVIPALAADADLPPDLVLAMNGAVRSAMSALEAHAAALSALAERLPREWRPPGVAETARRLERDGFDNDPRAVYAESEGWIQAEQRQFVDRVREAGLPAPTFAAAIESWNAVPADSPTSADAAIELYTQLVAKLNSAAAEAGLLAPPNYEVRVVPAPRGYGLVSPISNLPPVLRDPDSKPLFIVSVEEQFLEAHDRRLAATFAAHEATPGHALVEGWWHTRFGGLDTPIGLVHRHDVINVLDGYWGTMPFVEGMGLIAEGLLESSYSPLERVAVAEGRLLRAVRVRIDVGLSAGFLSRDAAAEELVRHLGMSMDAARAAVANRYGRRNFLGQAWTYWLGSQQIEALRADWMAARPGRSALDFHTALAQYPPLPPASLRRWLID